MSISFVRFHALALALIVGAPAAGVRALPAQQRPRTAPAAAATPARDATPHDSTVTVRNDSVSIRLVDADLRAAVQALAPYLDRPVVFASTLPGARVTVTTPHAVPRADVAQLLRGVLESQNLELVADTGLYRVQVKPAAPPPAAVGARATDTSRAGPVQLFVIHLRHARAADVAATVNALYGRASALGEIGAAPQPATLSQQLQANHIPPVSAPNANAVPGAAGRAATFTGDVTIVPDPRSNSLLIRASAHDFALIQAAVAELDTRPLQVLIEVVIAEVQRSWSLKFGVAASAPPGRVNGSKTTVSGSQAGPGLSDFVLNVMHLGSINLDATLSAAASKGDVKIL